MNNFDEIEEPVVLSPVGRKRIRNPANRSRVKKKRKCVIVAPVKFHQFCALIKAGRQVQDDSDSD